MSISKDLFLAILSLDSYNRGYGAGISDGGADDIDGLGVANATIGTATIVVDNGTAAAQTAGFYAISYTVGAGVDDIATGTTVISYRGTDVFASWRLLSEAGEEFPYTDLPIFRGDYDEAELALASQFRRSVGVSLADGVRPDTINGKVILTGHSLGGALAGFTGALFGDETTVVDHIGFYTALESFLDDWAQVKDYIDKPTLQEAYQAFRVQNPDTNPFPNFQKAWVAIKADYGDSALNYPVRTTSGRCFYLLSVQLNTLLL